MRLKELSSVFAMGACLSALAFSAPPIADSGTPVTGPAPASRPELTRLLGLLAERAGVHRGLLYRFQCAEDLTRRVVRNAQFSYSGFRPAATMHERYGIVLERGEDGVATAVRAKLDRKGKVRLSKKGEPVVARLPREFDPVVKAVPHAQAAIFDVQGQRELAFHLLKEIADDGPFYRIKCPDDHVAIEFLDRNPPKPLAICSAPASGQMCVDPHNGEISALVFYALEKTKDGCFWNRKAPFALVEQGLIESKTGARFPSRVQTIFSIDRRDDAVFEQHFESCGFTHVEVKESYGTVAGEGTAP